MNVLITGASGFIGRNVLLRIPRDWEAVAVYHRTGGLDEFIRQPGAAAGAKNGACIPKGAIDRLVPPTLVTEFHDVAAAVIELSQDRF